MLYVAIGLAGYWLVAGFEAAKDALLEAVVVGGAAGLLPWLVPLVWDLVRTPWRVYDDQEAQIALIKLELAAQTTALRGELAAKDQAISWLQDQLREITERMEEAIRLRQEVSVWTSQMPMVLNSARKSVNPYRHDINMQHRYVREHATRLAWRYRRFGRRTAARELVAYIRSFQPTDEQGVTDMAYALVNFVERQAGGRLEQREFPRAASVS